MSALPSQKGSKSMSSRPRALRSVQSEPATPAPITPVYRDGYASREEVAKQLAEWSNEFLNCREGGHNWQPRTATFSNAHGLYAISQSCGRCHTIRYRDMGLTGRIGSTSYEYPDGYLTTGLGRIVGDARDELRLQTVLRTYDVKKATKTQDRDLAPTPATRRKLAGEG